MREMKDSGIEWIGEIPSDWIINRIKFVADLFNGDRGKNYPSGDDLVDDGIVFLSSNNIHDVVLDVSPEKSKYITNEHYKLLAGAKIKINDIIYCLRGSVGLCAINQSASEGTIASSLLDIRPKNVSPKFLNYYLQSPANTIQTLMNMNGSCASNLSAENVANYYLIEPPINEQNKIANYLDQKCSEIDAITKDIQSQIETLEQYKRSVITEAVTKGLDPDVELKDSGIEWIGKISSDFRITHLKYVCLVLDGHRKPIAADKRTQNAEKLYDYYGASGVIDQIDGYTIDDDVLLIGEDGANLVLRNLPLIYQVHGKAWINNHAHILKPKNELNYYYAYYMLESLDIHIYITGSAQPKFNQLALLNMFIILPPYKKQCEIAHYLNTKCTEIDEIIAEKNKQLNILADYKKSLIFEYVTGKKEVPSA